VTDRLIRITTAVAVASALPWSQADLEIWSAAWAPVDLQSAQRVDEALKVGNRTVEAALQDLTNYVNLSTGLAHPGDRRAAVWNSRLLRGANEP
jgi:hypothetical protein